MKSRPLSVTPAAGCWLSSLDYFESSVLNALPDVPSLNHNCTPAAQAADWRSFASNVVSKQTPNALANLAFVAIASADDSKFKPDNLDSGADAALGELLVQHAIPKADDTPTALRRAASQYWPERFRQNAA